MKVIAINGSARKGGNTSILIEAVLAPLRAAGHDTEMIELSGKDIRGCTACGMCRTKADRQCHGRRDDANELIGKLFEADAIVLGSPTYFSDLTPEIKALIDRAGYVGRGNGNPFARKPGAAVVAVRRGGAIHTFDSINHFFSINEMITVGSSYWNIGIGGAKGEVEGDAEGMSTMTRLGENIAWLLDRISE